MAEIGSTLREARMRARIDISEVEARTKIRAKYLRAIENEEWDLLPGAVYVKSFLRTYGDFLGLDSRLLIDEFKRRYERPDDHEAHAMTARSRERERERRRPRRRPVPSSLSPRIVIGLALVVIVVALYELGLNNNPPSPTAGITPPTNTSTTHTGGHRRHHQTGTGTGSTTTDTGARTSTTKSKTNTGKATIQLAATALIWVCVEGPAHKLLVPGLEYTAGKTVSASASALWVALGNRNATITINGKPYTAAGSTDPVGLKITPTTVTPIAKPPLCE
jgi:cytoskeletal protein RodZ